MTALQWHAVDLGIEEMPEIRALFTQVFGHSMSDALWRWKYDAGRGIATGTRDEQGRLLAHYGGTARALQVNGVAVSAVQLGDVMVAAQARGILSRRGPFATAATAFLQHHIGSPGAYVLGFGFPNQRHTRLGEKLGLYNALGNVQELSWTCEKTRTSLFFGVDCHSTPLDWSDARTDNLLNGLWRALSQDARGFVIPRRDAPWWRHRFANHPEGPYRCWWVHGRWSRRLLGAIALKPGGQRGANWEILDLLGPTKHWHAMLCAARLLAQQGAADRLTGWFSDAVADIVRSQDVGSIAASQVACPHCVTRQRSSEWADVVTAQPWWLTGGDTDFR